MNTNAPIDINDETQQHTYQYSDLRGCGGCLNSILKYCVIFMLGMVTGRLLAPRPTLSTSQEFMYLNERLDTQSDKINALKDSVFLYKQQIVNQNTK